MSSNSGPGFGHGHSQARKSVSKGTAPPALATAPPPAVAGAGAGAVKPPPSSRSAMQQTTKSGSRLTRSEDLLARMRSYGYVPPKHQQRPEQYDYLFQDKETVEFLQKLTSRITGPNVLGKEEMAEIQQLKAENGAVYGKALEALVAKSRQERQAELDRALKKDDELQDLKRRIQEKKENIEKLKAIEPKFIARQKEKDAIQALVAYQTELIDNDCQRIRKKLNSGKDEQQERDEECAAIVQQKLRELDAPPMTVIDVMKQGLQLEDAIRDRMKVKVDFESDLLKKSMTPYEISRRFEQYGKDLERLKHAIIYEIIQKVQNDCQKEMKRAVAGKVPGFRKENERAARLTEDVRSKMAMEKREVIDRINKSVKHVKDRKLNQLRANLVKRFQEETRLIQLQKYESRKQIQSHFKVFGDALIHQFATLLICDGLFTLKNQHVAQFIDCLKNFYAASQKLKLERYALTCPITEANVPPEQQTIAKLFKTHRISLEVLRSPHVTKYALSLVRRKTKQLARREEKAKIDLGSEKVKTLFQKSKDFKEQWKTNGKLREKWDAEWKGLGTLQEKVKQVEEETKAHFMAKDNEVTKAIADKENLLEEARKFLQERRARVETEEAEKKAEAEAEAEKNKLEAEVSTEAEGEAEDLAGAQNRRSSIVGYSDELSFTSSLLQP